MNRFPSYTAVAGALALALSACGSSASTASHSASVTSSASTSSSVSASGSGSASAAVPAKSARVAIQNYSFRPTTITVAPGAKVTFTNHDQTNHTATANGGGFDTGTLGPGATKTVTLKKPGTYTYYCQFHAFMKATVIVK